ncbi:MAG TPA: methyltransferase [Acidimicrobiia bacterium]
MTLEAPPGGFFDPGSFRDPASRVYFDNGRVERLLSEEGERHWAALRSTDFFQRAVESGKLVPTTHEDVEERDSARHDLPFSPAGKLVHDRVPFWSYPYEWSFSMLKAAATLQLDLLAAALESRLMIKDATPYNIAFNGVQPLFADIGSFRPYEDGEPWLGYGQFCRLFLFPLMMRAHAGIPFQPLLRGSIDGIAPSHIRSVMRGRRLFRPGGLTDVLLQAKAERALAHSNRDLRRELTTAGFKIEMIEANIRRLQKVVERTNWRPSSSTWSDYGTCGHVGTQRAIKEDLIGRVLLARRHRLIWDLGANDGHFSKLAAPHADQVVAADADEFTIDRLFTDLRASGPANVLPLVLDLANPSPGLGWRGTERRPLEERGRPDLVLVLAILHHLVITANLPLSEVVAWLASLQAEVILEWVPPDDPMARQIAVNKRAAEIHHDYREDTLRELITPRFVVASESPVEGRKLFHLVPRG